MTVAEMEVAKDAQGWPLWPAPSESAMSQLRDVLYSGRWSISGAAVARKPKEREFAEAFADWMNTAFCIPTANGTSALVSSLASLELSPGDEVIVPGLTWVAPAIAALAVNARPVLVDVSQDTLCLCPSAVEAAITPRTRAIIVVHLYCSVADLDALVEISRRHGVALIEDCAQSHGSTWRGQKVGSIGAAGIFSMHQGKLLTSGEGGAVVTSDAALAAKMEQMRANGRRHRDPPSQPGEFDLDEIGQVVGTNMALSEFQAAILLDGLARLDALNLRRARAAAFLDRELTRIPGLRRVRRLPQVTAQSYYHYLIHFDPAEFHGWTPATLAAALSRRLGCTWQPTYPPMNRHPLYAPAVERRLAELGGGRMTAPSRDRLPGADAIHAGSVIVHHRILLSDEAGLRRVAETFEEIRRDATAPPGC